MQTLHDHNVLNQNAIELHKFIVENDALNENNIMKDVWLWFYDEPSRLLRFSFLMSDIKSYVPLQLRLALFDQLKDPNVEQGWRSHHFPNGFSMENFVTTDELNAMMLGEVNEVPAYLMELQELCALYDVDVDALDVDEVDALVQAGVLGEDEQDVEEDEEDDEDSDSDSVVFLIKGNSRV